MCFVLAMSGKTKKSVQSIIDAFNLFAVIIFYHTYHLSGAWLEAVKLCKTFPVGFGRNPAGFDSSH